LVGPAPTNDEFVEIPVVTGFNDERGFNDGKLRAFRFIERCKPLLQNIEDSRMKNLIEPRALLSVSEYDASELCAVHFAACVENLPAKSGDCFFIGCLAGFEKFVA
jgi:hypothetical protein